MACFVCINFAPRFFSLDCGARGEGENVSSTAVAIAAAIAVAAHIALAIASMPRAFPGARGGVCKAI